MNQDTLNDQYIDACISGDLEKVKELLHYGAHIDCKGGTPLENASGSNHVHIVQYLLPAHAPMHVSYFYAACRNDALEVFRYLLLHPDMNRNWLKDVSLQTALHLTCLYKSERCLEALIIDYNLPRNKLINNYLQKNQSDPMIKSAEQLFALRDLHDSLQNLPQKKAKSSRKI